MPSERIYLDHAASTPVSEPVAQAMHEAAAAASGHPSSLHAEGRRARDLLEGARERVAQVLGARPREIVFTSGGTEAANLAIGGVGAAAGDRAGATPRRVVVSAVEHPCVLAPAARLEARGFTVARVPPGPDGVVEAAAFEAALAGGAVLASLMLANHETGARMPVAAVAEMARAAGATSHCDAALGPGALSVRVGDLGVDLLSLSAHKWNGPKGIGALYVRRGTRLLPRATGGLEEHRLRAGTEDVVGAVGLAEALVRADASREERARRDAALVAVLEEGLRSIGGVRPLGPSRERRLPSVLAAEFDGCEGESLLVNLDLEGIAVSTGSACALGGTDPSPVLLAMGLSRRRAASSLRFSVGEGTTHAQVTETVAVLRTLVGRLRALAR